ncbi:probable pectinesterase 29 [Telopea speciosissima]|uniref:probable pectinesterase 29 n=1 Tax=Telopea speciosissima TaxID=54955 RepID=UPI001CC54FC4|nr:probable pectinesterase 29 [Telopea speciosissima]
MGCVVLVILLVSFGLINGESKVRDSKPHPLRKITVDSFGYGDFKTIQSAIDSVPSNNKQWICIYVKSGIYREKVLIPMDKPFILLQGEGRNNTIIALDDHMTLAESPTFSSFADNFAAKHISFKNTYNIEDPMGKNPRTPAVAALIAGDKSSFYKCNFFGLQDTLWDMQGRHYFKSCHIEGAVDFIFGMGQSIYEKCVIFVIAEKLDPYGRWLYPGYITAQGRNSPTDANGFVFKNCAVFGNGVAYLGRAWRDYSRVLFYNSSLSNIIVPQGWDAWDFDGHEYDITFAEVSCYGLGSNTSGRVSWLKKLSYSTVINLIDLNFIDTEGWLRRQPLHKNMLKLIAIFLSLNAEFTLESYRNETLIVVLSLS